MFQGCKVLVKAVSFGEGEQRETHRKKKMEQRLLETF